MNTTSTLRIALANVAFPASRDESLEIVTDAIQTAANGGASIVCFPECIVPGYRIGAAANPQDMDWLLETWDTVDALAAKNSIWVLLGTERVAEKKCYFATVNCALPKGCATTSAVIDPEGHLRKYHPYGNTGILFCDIDPAKATGLLAKRLRPETIRRG